jgi:predicted ATP-binding protein involved in virulence
MQDQDNSVWVESLKLENFRGFKQLSLQFSDQPIIVFFGENGAGKSTILDAIAFSLEATVDFLLSDGKKFDPLIHHKNIGHYGENSKVTSSLNIYNNLFTTTYDLTTLIYNNEVEEEIKKDKFHSFRYSPTPKDLTFRDFKNLKTADKIELSIVKETQDLVNYLKINFTKKSLPLFLYYSVNRLITQPSINQENDFDPLNNVMEADAYKGAFQATTHFNNFFNWYKILEDQENEKKSQILTEILNNNKPIEAYKEKLKTKISFVRQAIYSFIPYLNNIRVVREGSSNIRVLADKNGKEYDLEQLSQGEKILLSMVGDIALRLVILNPKLNQPLSGSGIVLIDEIDLHLHPRWQRHILKNLHTTFPNCQFIVTTHSPQVLGETKAADVFFLGSNEHGDLEAEKIEHIYGKNSNEVLEYFMQTSSRNKEIDERLNILLENIQDCKFSKVNTQLSDLETILGINAPALIKARLWLKKMKLRHAKDNKRL